MNIALIHPQIPQNTGNIARTCAATGAALHLVKPLGFSTDDKSLKRAGLDYWHLLDVFYYDSINDFMTRSGCLSETGTLGDMYFFTTKARNTHTDISYTPDSWLVFGSETTGLPEELLIEHPENCCRIPMIDESRSLNLSNSAAIAVYEALRQTSYRGLARKGNLHRLEWPEEK
ncbi:MAG: tRNA (cytidine(34)-2'-O)-methyltransferase [Spirochaetales bacterium]|uniref:Putative tRNA (cytidine(34)-2'-O)-methyltransferase n=1 Tax=Candidatus Thalassospirochaeta sargassi TaxID=3119039 RepID=A0AAJ1IAC0_9SPIO|nr:tRNA (cytidine(34)-2'-O)-methyltransferase [Spirochaetales bacterium]